MILFGAESGTTRRGGFRPLPWAFSPAAFVPAPELSRRIGRDRGWSQKRTQDQPMSWLREPNAEPIPGYRLIEPIGSGGFGEVWKCEAPGGIFKAIKFVYGNLNSLDVEGVRAEQELHALQRVREVRHPFVCSLDPIQ